MPAPLPPAPPAPTREGIAAEVEAELAGQVGPLETAAAGYGNAESRAIEELNALFGDIQPFVDASAQRVAAMYGATGKAQTGVFNEAYQRLNNLRSARAADAQKLAQQLGAPIPIEMFTQGTDVEMSAAAPEFAGDLLYSQGIAQAGVQEAEAFAGRVFPLQRARLDKETRNYYRDKIWELTQQIANIKSMKPGMINERLRQRQLENYQIELDRYKTEYDRFSTERAFKLQKAESVFTRKRQLAAEKAAKQDAQFQRMMAKKTMQLERDRFNAQVRQFAESQGLSYAQLKAQIASDKRQTGAKGKLQNQAFILAKKEKLTGLSDALFTAQPQGFKLVKVKTATGGEEYQRVPDPEKPGGPAYFRRHKPKQVLNQMLARAGITAKNKILYRFAIGQVIQAYVAEGYTNMPKDPSKWNAWWVKQLRKKTSPNITDSGAPTMPRR